MGTGRKYAKKPMTRPVKAAGDKLRRQKLQKKRLIALGMAEAKVEKLNVKEIRTLLQRPARIVADK